MNRHGITSFQAVRFRASLAVLTLLCSIVFAADVFARVGGGQSYGGGSNGGGDGDGGAIVWVIFQLLRLLIYLTIEYPAVGIPLDIILVAGVIVFFVRRPRTEVKSFTAAAGFDSLNLASGANQLDRSGVERAFDQLRRFDPNFSEIVFTDFCYALYAKVHVVRAQTIADVDVLSPYLSAAARNSLLGRNPSGLVGVKGIIIGSMVVNNVRGLETPIINISLVFEANYTEVVRKSDSPSEMTYYVRERWNLERRRDVLSPEPAKATALHCPRCGAALEKDTTGACNFCGAKIESGEFNWFVRTINLLSKEMKGPLLTADVPEVGTDGPSIVQHGFAEARARFEANHQEFTWGEFQARAKRIFDELQSAWSTLDWERARPFETDNIFQMHQYWIEAYKRAGLRNALDNCVVTGIQPVRIKEDAFYNSITLRIWAQGYDYTVNSAGEVVGGSKHNLRRWSEYWTFIRHRNSKPLASKDPLHCPNCAAPLKVNATGICEFCGGKITSGDFDWVLSRIEQDESYSG